MKLIKQLEVTEFFLIFCSFFFINSQASAQLSNWRFEMPVTITNGSSSQLTNYPVLILVNTQALIGAGYMQADGRDIRFSSACGSNLIDFYVENYINTAATRIWVKIASLPPNSSTMIYLYMGNPSASPAGTLSIFEGPYSSTGQVIVTNTNVVSNSQRGFRFSPERDILVTQMGKRVPNSTPRYVTLFNFNSHDILSQVLVPESAGQYNYIQLPNAVLLHGGDKYVLEVYQGQNDDYYFGVSSQIGPYLDYFDMRYANNCTQSTYPNQSYPNLHYGVPDFTYYIPPLPVNPAPTYTPGLVADTNTPSPPQNLTVIAGNQQATLKWKKNTEFDMSKYLIYRNTSNNPYTAAQIGTVNHPDTDFTATGLINGTPYYFWTKAQDRYCSPRTSNFSNVAVIIPLNVPNQEELPKNFALYQNYPNPFNPATDIKYDLPRDAFVKLVVYDLIGREIALLVNEKQNAGRYSVDWRSENIPSGVYIYKLTAGDFERTMKMVLLK